MSYHRNIVNNLAGVPAQRQPALKSEAFVRDSAFAATLPASITKSASKQTYYTIRLLADRDRTTDAYRAYAYFRWVDDRIDLKAADSFEQIVFAERQVNLMERCYNGQSPADMTVEERMLADLIRNDPEQNSGLRSYLEHMMAVMTFDAYRRGHLISQTELDDYSLNLATAVTEALHYFIGHGDESPHTTARYLAVTGAHITHMLRDTYEDVAAGYFNVPREFLASAGIQPCDIASGAYRTWVRERVELARSYFQAGKQYLRDVKNLRCRLAGYAYIARFEYVLGAIQREGYRLRPEYNERKTVTAGLSMGWSAFRLALAGH